MKLFKRPKKPGVLPMPLWLQGMFELGQAAVLSALVVILPLTGVWAADGFSDRDYASLARLSGQAWLLLHGVPLSLTYPAGTVGTEASGGLLSLIPLGLTLIPFFLCWRADADWHAPATQTSFGRHCSEPLEPTPCSEQQRHTSPQMKMSTSHSPPVGSYLL